MPIASPHRHRRGETPLRWKRAAAALAAFASAFHTAPGAVAADPLSPAHSELLSGRIAALQASFDARQHKRAHYAFDHTERFDLRLAPLGLEGLRLDAMRDAQRLGLRSALATVLSDSGLEKVETIRSLEREVGELETGIARLLMGRLRDPRRYFLAVFGAPESWNGSEPRAWGMRFDGHHLSLNWTAVPGEALSVTPLFLGGQPREVPEGFERAGLRVLAEEEERGVALVATLSAGERARARLRFQEGGTILRPMFVGDGPELEPAAALGMPVVEMSAGSARATDLLVETYLGNFAPAIAQHHRERIAAQRASLHFAYAHGGPSATTRPPRAGDPFYYRLQGDDLLIEFDDTALEADHVHVVFRDRHSDFARDLLAEHYGGGHSHVPDGASSDPPPEAPARGAEPSPAALAQPD